MFIKVTDKTDLYIIPNLEAKKPLNANLQVAVNSQKLKGWIFLWCDIISPVNTNHYIYWFILQSIKSINQNHQSGPLLL